MSELQASASELVARTPPRRKRRTLPVVASHEEFFRTVRQRNIRLAADIWEIAERRAARGDRRLLLYCTGDRGSGTCAKLNLQASVDAVWTANLPLVPSGHDDGTGGKIGTEAAESEVVQTPPLSNAELLELRRRALAEPQPAAGGPPARADDAAVGGAALALAPTIPATPGLGSIQVRPMVSKFRAQVEASRAATPGDDILFDRLGLRGEIVFYPRDGFWRLRDFYELLATCRGEPALQGIAPNTRQEGGFSIPRGEGGWRAMLHANVAHPRVPFDKLTPAEHRAVAAEIDFGMSCGELAWRPASMDAGGQSGDPVDKSSDGSVRQEDVWIDAMPRSAAFETDTFAPWTMPCDRVVRMLSAMHVEGRHWMAMVRSLESCGHRISQTVGFRISKAGLTVTGTKVWSSSHKHGVSNAPFGLLACALGQADTSGAGRRMKWLGGKPSDQRPAPALNVTSRVRGEGLAALEDSVETKKGLSDVSAISVEPRPRKRLRKVFASSSDC